MNILSSFEQSLNVLPPNDLRRKIRVSGAELLREVGLPHRRLESFRYTSLRELGEYQFFHGAALVSEPMDFSPFLLPGCVNVVFVNGVLLHKDDFPSGLSYEVRNERKTSAGEASLDFLRQAYFNGTHSFVIESGAQIEKPIHLVNLSQTGGVKLALNSLEIHFALGEGARVTLLEQHCWGEASPHLSIPAISVETSRGAALNHVRVKKGQGAGLHLGAVTYRPGENSEVLSFTYSQGLSLARVDTECVIEHPGVRFDFLSAYFLRLREHLDQSTFIHHKVGGSSSRQHFKGILDNSSRAVFSGRIRIEKGAQKAVSEQLNNNLLLSNMAEADSKPQLEIYADDVKATHGATVGSIDEEELFYLMSRAISARQARSMVAQGFLSGLVPAGLDQRVQGFLRKTMKEQLVEVGLP